MSVGVDGLTPDEFRRLTSSATTQALEQHQWPPWAERVDGIVGIWACGDPVGTVTSDGTTVHRVEGRFDLVRRDRNTFKAYRYFVVEKDDGSAAQVGPFKDLDYQHHRRDPPPWMEKLNKNSG